MQHTSPKTYGSWLVRSPAKTNLTMELATHILACKGLFLETGVDIRGMRSPKQVLEAMKSRPKCPAAQENMQAYIRLAQNKRRKLIVSELTHAVIVEFAAERGLTLHEAGIVLLRRGHFEEMKATIPELRDFVMRPTRSRDDLANLFMPPKRFRDTSVERQFHADMARLLRKNTATSSENANDITRKPDPDRPTVK